MKSIFMLVMSIIYLSAYTVCGSNMQERKFEQVSDLSEVTMNVLAAVTTKMNIQVSKSSSDELSGMDDASEMSIDPYAALAQERSCGDCSGVKVEKSKKACSPVKFTTLHSEGSGSDCTGVKVDDAEQRQRLSYQDLTGFAAADSLE